MLNKLKKVRINEGFIPGWQRNDLKWFTYNSKYFDGIFRWTIELFSICKSLRLKSLLEPKLLRMLSWGN